MRTSSAQPWTSSSASIARHSPRPGAGFSTGSSSSTSRARSWAWARSGPERSWVLLRGRDERDPLFLQIKEATNSVLEAHLPRSEFTTAGERVVQGQQMMQAASDIFLGWSEGIEPNRYYYWRQLRDMKGSVVVETILPTGMNYYAKICGWSLARAHARSGDAVAIAAYLGTDKRFEEAVAEFSTSYADQNERDYHAFREAIDAGRIEATLGV